ncbi:hypothetical protein H1R17_03700 [Flavobacterium sp. xlx-214]|uniref:hypothetical protein n=1 Tax=unclassified Flavobacterium TaxID=196869 RepID=UPI0013D34BB0|nr:MULTISPECIES: hypothetical protein [unclassified Flavobacterium]MBA5791995.1 hypothetical protein [Flavobacterium sp. xlx-221]QMI84249.1 hypothetical protein H1R17_03700 [Flavobacterium sp. xlx-214]
MKKITLALIAISGIAFSSCADVVPADDPTEGGTKLVPLKIVEEDGTIAFTYDAQNRFLEIKEETTNPEDYTLSTFKYEGDKLISLKVDAKSKTSSYVEEYTFTYQANKVTANLKYTANNNTEEYTDELKIDDKGRLINYDFATLSYDSSGNVNKIVNPDEEYLFQYDFRNGVFKNVKTPQWVMVYALDKFYTNSVNNFTKTTFIDQEDGEEIDVNIFYEYNRFNFPSKMTVIDEDAKSYISTIQYNTTFK